MVSFSWFRSVFLMFFLMLLRLLVAALLVILLLTVSVMFSLFSVLWTRPRVFLFTVPSFISVLMPLFFLARSFSWLFFLFFTACTIRAISWMPLYSNLVSSSWINKFLLLRLRLFRLLYFSLYLLFFLLLFSLWLLSSSFGIFLLSSLGWIHFV